MKIKTLLAAALVLSTQAFAQAPAKQPAKKVTYHTQTYTCKGGRTLPVTYLHFGDTSFAVVYYKGERHGLSQAVSASGSRFASLAPRHGLEWWEAKGEGTLSEFTGTDTQNTRPLLTGCRVR